MKTFNNDKKLKAELLKQLKHHQKLDTFMQGAWLTDVKVAGNGFKGCFYGCTMQTEDNAINKFSEKYNIDLWFCHLTERMFENLPNGEYQKFPVESIKVLPVGIDFNKIKSEFHYRLLMDKDHGSIKYCGDNEKCIEAVKQCAKLFKVPFNEIDKEAADSAADSAYSAYSAARSAASAAYSAAYSAYSAARSADSAAYSAYSAYSAAYSAHYVWMKEMLFDVIKNNS